MVRATPFSIRIVIKIKDGDTFERVYERGNMKLGKQAFIEFAFGNLLLLTQQGLLFGNPGSLHIESVTITEIPSE